MPNSDVRPWKTLKRKEIYSDKPWIQLFVEEVQLPSERVLKNFYQLEAMDFVSIAAITDDEKIVMERQYKHGARQVSLMVPGGGIEPGEAPLKAAQRELLEETGFEAPQWISMGRYVIDANHRFCQAFLFLAVGAKKVKEPEPDECEPIEVTLVELDRVRDRMAAGEIVLMSAMTTLCLALDRYRTEKEKQR